MKLTLQQQDIYFEQLLYPEEPIYNIGAKIRIEGDPDAGVLEKAYFALIQQHDAFRSVFVNTADYPDLSIVDDVKPLDFIDFSGQPDAEQEAQLYMETRFRKPFTLADGAPLYSFSLLKVREGLYYLFNLYHHVITDGWGTSLMFQRLVLNYNEILTSGKIVSTYTYSYGGYVRDDERYKNSDVFASDSAYWRSRFSLLPEALFKRLNPNVVLNRSTREKLIVSRDLYSRITRYSTELKASSFHVILAALFTYFGRKHEQYDFAIGLPVLNRSSAEFKKTVGLFMGVTLLRLNFSPESTIGELVDQMKNQLRQDYRHQRFPLGQLIKDLNLYTEKDRLYNITLSYEKHDYSAHFAKTTTTVIPLTHGAERVALAIYIREFDSNEDVIFDFDYNLNYFTKEAIEETLGHFRVLLDQVLAFPHKKIRELEFLTPREKVILTEGFNDSFRDHDLTKTVVDLYRRQAEFFADQVAIRDNVTSFTYREVDRITDNIAGFFDERYGRVKEPVGVSLNRSAQLILTILGILKSGRSYVPIDPHLPGERIRYIIGDSKVKVLVADEVISGAGDIEAIPFPILWNYVPRNGLAAGTPDFSDTAYIIYTSGSTGNPKGVEVGHRSLLNFLLSMRAAPGISYGDILYAVTTLSFDISILELLAPLIAGATVFVASQSTLSEAGEIIGELGRINPTIIQATPSFYEMLYNAGWRGSKNLKVLCGGDLLSEALAGTLIGSSKELWNMYGPTETTIWSSIKKIETPASAANIGKPIDNTRFYILDSFLNLVPVGIYGRIFIGGKGLAKGYLHNTALTDQKFVPDPFRNGQKIYETGDMGRWNKDGEIEFFGRNDCQVKIRGYRIELVEIESHLNRYLGLKNAIVLDVKPPGVAEKILVGYIPSDVYKMNDVEDIKEYLRRFLPEYMVPYIFLEVESFPETHNKKIDRASLRSMKYDLSFDDGASTEELSTREGMLMSVWRRVLKTDSSIGRHHNFFHLGGHSVLAVRMIADIYSEFSVKIRMKDVFENPTIARLSAVIESHEKISETVKIEKAVNKAFYELTPNQLKIWLACMNADNMALYNMFAVYSIHGPFDIAGLEAGVRSLIRKNEILRTNIIEIDDMPCQQIRDFDDARFRISQFEAGNDGSADSFRLAFSGYAFDLSKDLLLKIAVCSAADGKSELLFLTHHIVMDGTSISMLVQEIIEQHESGRGSDSSSGFQFRDYSEWLNGSQGASYGGDLAFWDGKLSGYRKRFFIKPDPSNLFIRDNKGRRIPFVIPGSSYVQLKELAVRNDTTVFSVLFSIFGVFLAKISGFDDICVGLVTNGRDIPEFESVLGMMADTLPFRYRIDLRNDISRMVASVVGDLLETYRHMQLPQAFDAGKVFDIVFVYQNNGYNASEDIRIGNLSLRPIVQEEIIARLPVVFNFYEGPAGIYCELDYDANSFEKDTIEALPRQLLGLVASVCSQPLKQLMEQDIGSEKGVKDKRTIDFDFDF